METVRQCQELETALELLAADLQYVRALAAELAVRVCKENEPKRTPVTFTELQQLGYALLKLKQLGLLSQKKGRGGVSSRGRTMDFDKRWAKSDNGIPPPQSYAQVNSQKTGRARLKVEEAKHKSDAVALRTESQKQTLALRQQKIDLEKERDERNRRLAAAVLEEPLPEKPSAQFINERLLVAYNAGILSGNLASAVSAMNCMAEICGLKINRSEIGGPNEFAHLQTTEEIIERFRRGKHGDYVGTFLERFVKDFEREHNGDVIDVKAESVAIEDKREDEGGEE
jgi:hypothetical protein